MSARRGAGCALLAAALYAFSTPASKLLLGQIGPTMLAALLYLGAGLGMGALGCIRRRRREARLARGDLPYVLGMVALDTAAPILLLLGLTRTAAANASLLNNFEIVATAAIARVLFGERIPRRLWGAIAAITGGSILLSFEGGDALRFSLLILLACLCWGLENNCTRRLSAKDPLQIVVVKGLGSGTGSLLVALACGERFPAARLLPAALILGFIAYGLSIYFYVYAQRVLGAAKTSAYYAFSPFIGVAFSFLVFHAPPGAAFWAALVLMAAGVYFASTAGGSRRPGVSER